MNFLLSVLEKDENSLKEWQNSVYQRAKYRNFLWREDPRPYFIFLSEIMLQQTQAERVVPFFYKFIEKFTSILDLADANFEVVVNCWNGLGYNRRAKYLHGAAKIFAKIYDGVIPKEYSLLCKIPGIGRYTAAAILVFGYDLPFPFLETNVRTLFLNEFFSDSEDLVSEAEFMKCAEIVFDYSSPRRWGYALMDLGHWYKNNGFGKNRLVKSYRQQSIFKGSFRQKRGEVVRKLLSDRALTIQKIEEIFGKDDAKKLVMELSKDGITFFDGDILRLWDTY